MYRGGVATSSSPSPGPAGGREPLSFEQSIEQIEQIIARIESGEVGLEKSIAEYERGVALIRRCREILEQAEQRVETLTRQLEPPASSGPGEAGSGADAEEPPF